MSRCGRGPVVFWLLTMLLTCASFCTLVCAEEHRNGIGLGGSADWKDWFLDEDTRPASSEAESGPLVRRITPKSVFVAPSFSGCSEGYRQDGMGRCVKLVKVNQAAQLDFLLQKLNSKFAPVAEKNDGKEDVGPFHVSIPLGFASYNGTKTQNVSALFDHRTSSTDTPTTTDVTTTDANETLQHSDIESNTSRPSSDVPIGPTTFTNESGLLSENVKRQPGKPFVIVVANETNDSSYKHEESTEDAWQTTTEVTTSNTITTAAVSDTETGFSDETSETTTETINTNESTPFSVVETTTESSMITDPSTVVPLEPSKTDHEFFTETTTENTAAPTTTVFLYTPVDEELVETLSEKDVADKDEIRETDSMKDDEILDVYDSSSTFGQRQVVDCVPPFHEVTYGRIVDSSGRRCRPVDIPTTGRYPLVWTTTPKPQTPYYVRFPADDFESRPSVSISYSSSSPFDDLKKNGFVRFPERISSPHRPHPHIPNSWDGDGASSSSTSSGSWYPPPSSWFPLLHPHKHWPNRYDTRLHYENNDGNRPMSTIFRKQFHDYRPPPPSHPTPLSWIDKRMPWPHRH